MGVLGDLQDLIREAKTFSFSQISYTISKSDRNLSIMNSVVQQLKSEGYSCLLSKTERNLVVFVSWRESNCKVYGHNESQKVISEAWNLAINHLKETLGDQYTLNVTEDALPSFYDKVQQDITFKMICPVCSQVDIEGNFMRLVFEPSVEICYDCYQEELGK